MAIVFLAGGAASAGTTQVTPAYPATVDPLRMALLWVINKYPFNAPATPAGWNTLTNFQANGGAGSPGVDSGTVYGTVFWRITDGTEDGATVTVDITGGNSAIGRIFTFSKAAAKHWAIEMGNGVDSSAGTDWSVTTGAMDIAAGDMMAVFSAINSNVQSYTAEALAQTGTTFGTGTERADAGTTQGDDCGYVMWTQPVDSGSGTGAVTFTMTANATSGSQPAGVTIVVRLREVDVGITASAIESAESFGTPVESQTIAPSAVGSAEGFGSATVDAGGTFITPSSIASAESVGSPTLGQSIAPGSIGSAEAVGAPALRQGIAPTAIGSAEAFGTPSLSQRVQPSSIGSLESFGAPKLTEQIAPASIGSAETFGTPLLRQAVAPASIGSAEAFGTATVTTGAGGITISPSSIASVESFGSPTLEQRIAPTGVTSMEAFGTPAFGARITASGIASIETFGTPSFGGRITPASIASAEAFGTASVAVGALTLFPSSIASLEAFGSATVSGPVVGVGRPPQGFVDQTDVSASVSAVHSVPSRRATAHDVTTGGEKHAV